MVLSWDVSDAVVLAEAVSQLGWVVMASHFYFVVCELAWNADENAEGLWLQD